MNGLMLAIGLALLLATLPGTIELILVTFPAFLRGRERNSSDGASLKLAVITPAHNEARDLPNTIASLLNCEHPLAASQLHVIADNCSDETAEIATDLGCTVFERVDDTLRGKGYALNYAFEKLEEEGFDVFIIVDADTRVDPNFLDAIRQCFSHGAAASQTCYRVGNPDAGFRPRLMHIAFLAFNYLRPLSRRNAGFSAGILGNGFALSAETLQAVPYNSFSIVEDLEYHLRLVRSGRKVEFISNTSVWSDMPVSSGEAQSQRERWEGGRFRMVLDQVPKLLKDISVNRSFTLIEPLLELLLMPLSYHIGLLLVLLVVGLILGTGLFSGYALLALLLVAFHVVAGMLLGGASGADWKALLTAPFYMAWKFANLSSIVKSAKKNTEWKRTSREDK